MKKRSRRLSLLILFGIVAYLLGSVIIYFRYFQSLRNTALHDVNVIEEVSYDFEDILPMKRIFAYVWFAYLDWEFCAAVASLKRLQNLRKSSLKSSPISFSYFTSLVLSLCQIANYQIWPVCLVPAANKGSSGPGCSY